jgi:hypothetical protein
VAKPSYRDNARRVAEAMSKTDPLHTLDEILEHLNGRLDRWAAAAADHRLSDGAIRRFVHGRVRSD